MAQHYPEPPFHRKSHRRPKWAFFIKLLGLVTAATALRVTNPVLISIAVTPANPSAAKGDKVRFTATGTFSDGSMGNLTRKVTWSSSNTSVATITKAGVATAKASGASTIAATLNALNASTVLTVQ